MFSRIVSKIYSKTSIRAKFINNKLNTRPLKYWDQNRDRLWILMNLITLPIKNQQQLSSIYLMKILSPPHSVNFCMKPNSKRYVFC